MGRWLGLVLVGGLLASSGGAAAEVVLTVAAMPDADVTSAEEPRFAVQLENTGDTLVAVKLWADLTDVDGQSNATAMGRETARLKVVGYNLARLEAGGSHTLYLGTEPLPVGSWRVRWSAIPQLSDGDDALAEVLTQPFDVAQAPQGRLVAILALVGVAFVGLGITGLLWYDRRLDARVVPRDQLMAALRAHTEAKAPQASSEEA